MLTFWICADVDLKGRVWWIWSRTCSQELFLSWWVICVSAFSILSITSGLWREKMKQMAFFKHIGCVLFIFVSGTALPSRYIHMVFFGESLSIVWVGLLFRKWPRKLFVRSLAGSVRRLRLVFFFGVSINSLLEKMGVTEGHECHLVSVILITRV